MTAPMVLHFTLGPVQGFIGSARRTRDYWAGSFLLGYLSGTAMRAVEEGYGTISFPHIRGDPFYEAVCGRRSESRQYIATLPNRFCARIDRPDDFARDKPCQEAVQSAWKAIADAVWGQFLGPIPAAERSHTRAIWDRQIDHFFEMAWVMGPDPGDGMDGDWLDRRKNWRSHAREEEPGDHCRIMSDYQELSGWVRSTERANQDAFWDAMREQILETLYRDGGGGREYELLELRNTERLCAVALVKRLFPVLPVDVLKQLLGWVPDGPGFDGSGDRPGRLRFWPSTAYMAAVPWLEDAWRRNQTACATFTDRARDRVPVEAIAERESRVPSLAGGAVSRFGMLDGGLFFEDALKTEIAASRRQIENLRKKLASLPANGESRERNSLTRDLDRVRSTHHRRNEVLHALRALIEQLKQARSEQQTHRQRHFEQAREFYALLLMDGDRGGALMRPDKLTPEIVSAGFTAFQGQVPDVIADHDGVLIYAGADDVKALLPLDRALGCTTALHGAYLRAFAEALGNEQRKLEEYPATISAGLVFAHYHVPLASVIREAHLLLDDVAKDGNGRNSIAISVWKPSGKAAQYVTAFARERHGETGDGPIDHLMALARSYATEPMRSSSFIYNIRERFAAVLMPEEGASLLQPGSEELKRLLLSQWTKGRAEAVSGAKEAVDEFLRVCCARRGDTKAEVFRLDGALIAKFLADNGVGATEGD